MYPNIHNVTKHRSAFLHGYYTKRLIKSKFYTKTLKVSEEIRKLWQETKKLKLENFRYWKTGETEIEWVVMKPKDRIFDLEILDLLQFLVSFGKGKGNLSGWLRSLELKGH